jgi:sugar O-acyltransferase (sialic acid O-acetyltransferase NeuD family)
MRKLVIYGATFLDCVKLVEAINRARPTWTALGFLDDTAELASQMRLGLPVLGGMDRLAELARDPDIDFFNNVRGHWRRCRLIVERLAAVGRVGVSLIHPAIDMSHVTNGAGCAISDGTVIAAMTTIGGNVTIRLGCTISHDVDIADYVALGPGVVIGSHVRIGARAMIGAGAIVVTGVEIGADVTVAAGALVTKNVEAGETVAGAPARKVPAPARSH